MSRDYIDLRRHAFMRQQGEITVFGCWVMRGDGSDDTEPCLVLMPTYRKVAKPFVIALSAAFKYDNPVYLARASHIASVELGFEPTLSLTTKIAGIINDHMSDLISMPPEPVETHVVGEAHINMPDGERRKVDILDYEEARL